MASHPAEPTIALAAEADNNAFAVMLAQLVHQNINDDAGKRADFQHLLGRVALGAEDAQIAVTLHFAGGILTVYDGIVGIPDVTVRGQSDDLMKLSLVQLRTPFRLPNPLSEGAKGMSQALKAGRLKIFGGLWNIPMMLRLTRIMAVS
jgi:hypothetical protein